MVNLKSAPQAEAPGQVKKAFFHRKTGGVFQSAIWCPRDASLPRSVSPNVSNLWDPGAQSFQDTRARCSRRVSSVSSACPAALAGSTGLAKGGSNLLVAIGLGNGSGVGSGTCPLMLAGYKENAKVASPAVALAR